MLTAYFDTGILVKLYAREINSREAGELVDQCGTPLHYTDLHNAETTNALHLKRRRQEMTDADLDRALRLIQGDLDEGVLVRTLLDWPRVWKTCRELSERHAVATGCRTLDALHVAAAIVLGAREFVSFDIRQRKLAERAGLRLLPSRR